MSKYSYDFSVIGGDKRQYYLARMLKKYGYRVCTYLLESFQQQSEFDTINSLELAIQSSRNILAPIPMSTEKNGSKVLVEFQDKMIPIEQFKVRMQAEQRLFAGCMEEELKEELLKKGVVIFDYMNRNDITIYNSIATAEGIIAEAICHSPKNIHGSKCVVLGYGVCGKTIVQYLKGMGAHVTVCVRRNEVKAQAKLVADQVVFMEGMITHLQDSDFIFNTIPEMILNASVLESLSKRTMIFDIASGVGGIDYDKAKEIGIKSYLCKGLPGKYAPESSARMLADVILQELKQKKRSNHKKEKV